MPPDLNTAGDIEVYRTRTNDFTEYRPDNWVLRVVARLEAGTTVAAADAEMGALAVSLESLRVPNAEQGMRFRVESLPVSALAPIRTTLNAFVVAVVLVLLIACANVANLLLVRDSARVPELAVRSALGAGRSRIVRQLITECAVLSFLGAGLGIGLAFAIVRVVGAMAPAADLLQVGRIDPDLRVLAFAATMAVATTILAGLVPSLRVTGRHLSAGFLHRGAVGGHHRFTGSLAVTQIALSMALLAGVGLMFRSVSELQKVPLGFEPSGVLTATVTQPERPDEERSATEEALIREVSALPGVQAVGIVFPLPMNGVYERMVRFVDHRLETEAAQWRDGYFRTISPGYLDAMGIGLISGRDFTADDNIGEYPVVIVDEELARHTWPGEDPMGRRVRAVGMGVERDSLYFEVIGVVEYAPQWDHRDVQPTLYFPRFFYRSHEVSLALRVAGDPLSLAVPLRNAIRNVEADLPAEVQPLGRYVSDALGPTRFVLILLGAFACVAVGLTGVGLYGVLAYGVRQRTREIGVRMAMGAEEGAILRGVAKQGGRLALLGTALGLGGSLVLGSLLRSHLFQVGVMDPAALLGTSAVIVLVAALASWIPARVAASVDPVEALRAE
ncbi:FtsX-like permease family protein [Gemmatimonadota bacterium]